MDSPGATPRIVPQQEKRIPQPSPDRKTRFMMVTGLIERFKNGSPHDAAPEQQGLGIARHERKRLSAYISSVDLALDHYDEIFSDFDRSPYSSRALSNDFVGELTRRFGETGHGQIEVVFSLPRAVRNRDTEALIKERLRKYFQWKLSEVDEDIREEVGRGMKYIGVGAAVIACSTVLTHMFSQNLALNVIGEILLVPGWVGEFLGLEKIIDTRPKVRKQREFYEKFRDATYVFVSNEDVLEKMIAAKGARPAPQKDGGRPEPREVVKAEPREQRGDAAAPDQAPPAG